MNRLLLSIFATGLCFAVGSALQCYNCKVGLWDLCYTTKVTCGAGEDCFSGVGKAAGFVDVKTKGCLKVSECNKTQDVNFLSSSTSNTSNTVYSMTKTCCDSDLCNSAPPGLLPRLPALTLAALCAALTGLL